LPSVPAYSPSAYFIYVLFIHESGDHRDLHSFPTRRSSDLTLVEKYGDKWLSEDETKRLSFFREYGLTFELDQIKADLHDFRVDFDTWFSEASLYEKDKVTEAVEKLKAAGVVYESDGATWLRSTDYGDDK